MISPRFSWLQDIAIKAFMPFYLPKLVFKILFLLKPARNGFKNN